MQQRTSRSVVADFRRSRHWLWLGIAIALVAVALVLFTRAAAAQTERGIALIEQTLAAKPDKHHGARLYCELCSSCHGRRAYGSANPVTPSLAGQVPLYVIKQLVDFAEGDRTEPEMHRVVALKQLSSVQAIRDISAFLADLPANPSPELGDGTALAAGKRYYDGLCAFCHGPQAQGNADHATPALSRQHYSYLLMQARRLAVGHRYSVPIEVIEVLEKVSFDELRAIADYASRLPAAPPIVGSPDPQPVQ
jgi:cytochrome c553